MEPWLEEGADKVQQPRTALVVGGGLAGMISALELAKRGVKVRLLEASDHMGGRLGARPSDEAPDGVWEHGLHHFFINVYEALIEK